MIILDYIEATGLSEKSETERATLLCYYFYKETSENAFSMQQISDLMESGGFNKPNTSRLRERLTKGKDKSFLASKKYNGKIEFIPAVLQSLDKSYSRFWDDTETVESNSELLEEAKFCGKRNYLDRLIRQINNTYANHCYDACAVLMRRLFEVLLVLAYQHYNIDDQIKDASGNGYIMLEGIVSNAKNNVTLKFSRIKKEFDIFRMVGNLSAHSISYTAGVKDIDDIKLNYRVMTEELFTKAGLM